ncbi:hepatitis A virus cellular receptor 2 isoform X3 [Marmota marmota marmota]|uniref:hepatitis A virus cellular receptor 2 isoform X3 n=1 Tax=Marmota marmota marmota TaxID=9994 RepID=UPI002093C938|nr:hepatitis A virus cellular receptor 2 isoform X3 [Marmota marmota marmota]
MFSHLSFNGILLLLLLLLLTMSSEGEYIVEVGQDASLPCSYNPISSKSLVPVCWGKESCPVFGCKDLVLSTDETNVKDQKSSRYQLKGNLHKGDVSLTIVNVTPADSGTYCCRIQFRGPVNDYKLNVELIIKPAKVNPAPTAQRDVTTVLPRMLTTEGHGSVETQTLGTFHDKNQTQISTFADEFQSFGATTRRGLYIGVGISAGLALTLIFSALILKFSSRWPTPVPQDWQMQQQTGCAQRRTSTSLRKTYMRWRTRMRTTAISAVSSNTDHLWVLTFLCH